MQAMSDEFKTILLSNAQTSISKVEIWRNGVRQETVAATLNGYVTADATAATRRTAYVTITDLDGSLTPADANALLTPFGTEFKPYRGLRLRNGVEEYKPLGIFGITNTAVQDSGQSFQIRLDGKDRSNIDTLDEGFSIPVDTNVGDAIFLLLNPFINDLEINFAPTTYRTPLLYYNAGASPWAAALELAQSAGCSLYFDVNGILVMKKDVDPTNAPVDWKYRDDQASFPNLALYTDRRWGKDAVNRYVVTGEAFGDLPPAVGIAEDTNPNSPTYIGRFKNTKRIQSSLPKTNAAANSMAQSLLYKSMGAADQIDFPSVVNPAHEETDVIEIVFDRSKINSRYVMDHLTIPLEATMPMNVTCRQVQTSN